MAKKPARSRKTASKKLTRRQVIDQIMKLVAAAPAAGATLPAAWTSRKHWEKTFSPRNKFAAPVLETLQELPGFTELAPRPDTIAGWAKLFGVDNQLAWTLGEINASASFTPIHRPRIRHWRDAFGKDEAIQRVRPQESFDYIHNPHRGTTTFQRFQGEALDVSFAWHDWEGPIDFPRKTKAGENVKFVPRTTLTYCRWPWAWMEPQKGKYHWDFVEATLNTARERGQTAQLRFQPYARAVDYKKQSPKSKRHPPEISVDVPDWYWDTGAAWIEHGPFGKNEPDCNDPLYVKHFSDYVRAFGERFDGHPDLESVDIAYAGFWGEAGGNSTEATARKLADVYLESFPKTQLVGMLGTPGMVHAFKARSAGGKPVGWRADSYGDYHIANVLDVPEHLGWNHMIDCYAQTVHEAGASDAWKTAPVTMEASATVAHWVMYNYDIDRIIEEGYKYHTSVFMPKSVFFPEKTMEKLLAFDRKIGYRFAVRQIVLPLEARPGATASISLFADNVGCAPIYRPYRLALRFKQGAKSHVVKLQEDIRTWLPGHNVCVENFTIPADLEGGDATVALGIVDQTNTPKVWFAIDGKTDDGWHPLTSITVLK